MSKKMIKNIEMMVYDFDGVMTDNRVLITEDGKEAVFVNRADGLAVSAIRKMGIKQIIISTEKNKVVKVRADKLKIGVIQSVDDKKKVLSKYLKLRRINPENVVYIGNDLNDLPAMQIVGWPIAPADACREVKSIAKIVLGKKGGQGIIRELFDMLENERR